MWRVCRVLELHVASMPSAASCGTGDIASMPGDKEAAGVAPGMLLRVNGSKA